MATVVTFNDKRPMRLSKKIIVLLTLFISFKTMSAQTIYDFSVLDAKEQTVSLSDYKGKVMLIVNTATRCGFTPQYKELEELYEKYVDQGFEILDFPCNQFGNQAPGTVEEIKEFCSINFKVRFKLFEKVEVNGENESPLFTFLKARQGFQGFDPNHKLGTLLDDMMKKADPDYASKSSIKWNFTKFLVDREGNVVKRFEPTDGADKIEEALKALL